MKCGDIVKIKAGVENFTESFCIVIAIREDNPPWPIFVFNENEICVFAECELDKIQEIDDD